jgi:hypothetical protein
LGYIQSSKCKDYIWCKYGSKKKKVSPSAKLFYIPVLTCHGFILHRGKYLRGNISQNLGRGTNATEKGNQLFYLILLFFTYHGLVLQQGKYYTQQKLWHRVKCAAQSKA